MDKVWTVVPRITPSSANDLECPKKYKTLRIDKNWPMREPMDSVAHGIAVHDVLRQVYATRVGGQPNLAHVEALTRTAVYRGRYSDRQDRQEAVQRVIAAVCGYVGCDDAEDVEGTIDLERQSEFVYQHQGKPLFMVSAKLDRTLVRASQPTRLVNRDYKTTRPRIDLREAFVALWVAKKQYPGYSSYALELDWIDEDNRVRRDVIEGHELRGQHAVMTELALNVLMAQEWPAIPGDTCTYCPLRSQCQGLPVEELAEGEDVF